MRHLLFTVAAAIAVSLLAAAPAPASGSQSACSSGGEATSAAARSAQAQGPLDEHLDFELTRPIPIKQAPAGCMVVMTERYCRTDNEPVKSFLVLHQRTVGRSSIENIAIDNGCVVVQVRLGVDEDKTGNAQCVGGEPLVRVRLLLSARPAPER
jgi:hypothetical protein